MSAARVRRKPQRPRRSLRLAIVSFAGLLLLIAGAVLITRAFQGSPQPEPLEAVICPTSSECLAVGGSGRLLLSTDSAATWSQVSLPSQHYLYGVACTSPARCVAVGDGGTVVVSKRGVQDWGQVDSGTHEPLSSVTCTGAKRCYATGDGDTIVMTTDGGEHWGSTSLGLDPLNAVACSRVNQCVAVSSNAENALYTPDGGHWSAARIPTEGLLALRPMNGVSCSSSTCVSVGGNGLVADSHDGGATWSFVIPSSKTAAVTMNGISCITGSECVAVGAAGAIVTTDDGGASWNRLPSPTAQTLLGVNCHTATRCIAVGDGGTVLSTEGSLLRWTQRQGAQVPLNGRISVLVVGDSFAHSAALYVGRVSSSYGVMMLDGGLDGCGLARGDTLGDSGQGFGVVQHVLGPCSSTGPGWPAWYRSDINQAKPDVSLLVLGPRDLSAREIGGQWSSPGQGAYDAYYRKQLESAVGILISRGSPVVVSSVPYVMTTGPQVCIPLPATATNCPTEEQRVNALDRLANEVAAEHPGRVSVLDLGQRLSPKDHFTQTVDGVDVRAADGVHLSEPGGQWLAPWLIPQLISTAKSQH